MSWYRSFVEFWSGLFGGSTPSSPADSKSSQPAAPTSGAAETLEQFASRACQSTASRDIALNDVGQLIDLLIAATMAEHGVEKSKAFRNVMAGLAVICPKCGQFNDNSVAMLAMANDPIMKKAVFGGPKVASLAQSRCPLCGGTSAKVVFDPTKTAA